MTRRERFLAAMRFEPVDRIPWAPKMFFSYYLQGQEKRWQSLSLTELADYLDVEMMLLAPHGRYSYSGEIDISEKQGGDVRTRIYSTRLGELRSSMAYSHSAQEWHPVEPLIKTRADYDTFRFMLEQRTYEPDPKPYLTTDESLGDRGVVFVEGPATPFMQLLQYEIDMPEIYYHLQDFSDQLESLMETLEEANRNVYRLIAETTPCDYVMIGENTSTTLTSPDVYRRHCQPALQRYSDAIRTAGKKPMVHMCGHLLALLPDIADLEVAAIEAYTSPPVGNARLCDGRTAFGRTTAIIGGLNAVALSQMPLGDLLHWVEGEIRALPEKTGVVLTSGGVLPPDCAVDRLRLMGEALRELLRAD